MELIRKIFTRLMTVFMNLLTRGRYSKKDVLIKNITPLVDKESLEIAKDMPLEALQTVVSSARLKSRARRQAAKRRFYDECVGTINKSIFTSIMLTWGSKCSYSGKIHTFYLDNKSALDTYNSMLEMKPMIPVIRKISEYLFHTNRKIVVNQ